MTEQHSVATAGASGTAEKGGDPGKVPAAPRPAAPASFLAKLTQRKWLLLAALVVLGGLAYLAWQYFQPPKLPPGFAKSNGRIEATEIDVAAKIAGRIRAELVDEGDFVTAGQVV